MIDFQNNLKCSSNFGDSMASEETKDIRER
jgi:hypothetical protein